MESDRNPKKVPSFGELLVVKKRKAEANDPYLKMYLFFKEKLDRPLESDFNGAVKELLSTLESKKETTDTKKLNNKISEIENIKRKLDAVRQKITTLYDDYDNKISENLRKIIAKELEEKQSEPTPSEKKNITGIRELKMSARQVEKEIKKRQKPDYFATELKKVGDKMLTAIKKTFPEIAEKSVKQLRQANKKYEFENKKVDSLIFSAPAFKKTLEQEINKNFSEQKDQQTVKATLQRTYSATPSTMFKPTISTEATRPPLPSSKSSFHLNKEMNPGGEVGLKLGAEERKEEESLNPGAEEPNPGEGGTKEETEESHSSSTLGKKS